MRRREEYQIGIGRRRAWAAVLHLDRHYETLERVLAFTPVRRLAVEVSEGRQPV